MSRRRRCARERSVRSRVTREKVLRRRARRAGARRAATAAAAAVTLAASGTSAVGTAVPASGTVGASLVPCADPHTPPSNPSNITDVGGTLFFTADDGIHGRELWKSDGTKAGTVLVRDIGPRSGDSGDDYKDDRGPSDLTAVGGTLFFTADDGTHGRELWKSNGTKAGTVLVKDIESDSGEYYDDGPSDLTGVGGTLFFTADDGTHGAELWKSNGTRAGTVLVKDIDPNDDDGEYDSDSPYALTGVGGTLFFSADDGTHGSELWQSQGTKAGTVLVKDNHPDACDSEATAMTGVGGTVFFQADDGTHGSELWKSNGNEAGTVLVKDIDPAPDDNGDDEYGDQYPLVGVGGTVFFSADDGVHGRELWASDGNETGTVLVKDIRPNAYGSAPSDLAGVGGTLFFTARDGSHGPELWKSTGNEAGTVLVKDIRPGVNDDSQPSDLTGMGGKLFFSAGDGTRGSELWTSDGTEAGTVLVKDINLGGSFTVAAKGKANTGTGTMQVKVTVAGAGALAVSPANGSLLKSSAQDVPAAGATTVTLRPTRAGLRTLKRVGSLRVTARFTFTPCGGKGTSVVRPYTLRLR